jgi:hypothetical protein
MPSRVYQDNRLFYVTTCDTDMKRDGAFDTRACVGRFCFRRVKPRVRRLDERHDGKNTDSHRGP